MSKEFTYWTSVLKRVFILVFSIIGIFLCFKIAIFYMPFLIAFIISILIEPIIKKMMNKFRLSRKMSSIIVFTVTFSILIGLITWGIFTFVSESSNLLSSFNDYYNKASNEIQQLWDNINSKKIKIPDNILEIVERSSFNLLEKISNYFQDLLTNTITSLTTIPIFGIYFGVTILALYFICTDKIYMLDELEHHLPEKWMKELGRHIRELIKVLGGYLKAQITLVIISFIICLVGLYILYFVGLNVRFPLIIAIRNCICRCTSYTRLWNGYDTMGSIIFYKWSNIFRYSNCHPLDNYVSSKTVYRA